jgi:hypothetical protein
MYRCIPNGTPTEGSNESEPARDADEGERWSDASEPRWLVGTLKSLAIRSSKVPSSSA